MSRRLLLLTLLALAVLPPARPAAAAPPAPPALDIGGFIVEGAFREAYLALGAEALGAPLSEALPDPAGGPTLQYFVYARLELHGDRVELSRLGATLAAGRADEPPFRWLPPDAPLGPGRAYVAESGHSLGGAFGWHHATAGGTALLGHPISEEFVERQPDGSELLVQYFERALLRYHPTLGGGGEVRRAPLGRELAERSLSPAELAPGRPLVALATATLAYPAGGDGHNIELAASRLDGAVVEPGGAISFLGAVGPISAEAGYRPGSGIVGGALTDELVGGGVCTVSTLLLRAAWAAGLPVVEQRAHRFLLGAYADAPGLDAAVFDPGQDLRARNDTGGRLYVAARAAGGVATVTIWGRGDGREVRLEPPERRGAGGLEVLNRRSVALPGAGPRRDLLRARYEPRPGPAEPPAPVERPEGDGGQPR